MRRNRISQCLFPIVLSTICLSAAIIVQAQAIAPAPSPSPSPSLSPEPSPTPTLESRFFKNILSDQKAIWTAPFKMQGEDAKWLVPLGLATTGLIVTDRRTGDEIAESTAQLQPSRVISYAGNTFVVGGAAAAFYVVGRVENNYRARETGLLGAQALINSGIVVTVIKAATQRRRPMQEKHSDFFDGGSSFPSGHAITAWTFATVVANEYHEHLAVQITAYGIATAVSIARFTAREHYLSDSLVGSALGYGIGWYVYHAHHVERSDAGVPVKVSTRKWPVISPEYDRHNREYGVALAWSF